MSSKSRFAKPARLFLKIALAGLITLLTLLVLVAIVGVRIDAAPYRASIGRLLSEQLGRAVYLDGALQLELSMRPAMLIRKVRIAQPKEFGQADFLAIGELRVSLDLALLLKNKLRAEEIAGSDVRVLLQQRADGRNNWTFALPANAPAPAKSVKPLKPNTPLTPNTLDQPDSEGLPELAANGLDIRKIILRKLNVEYRGVNGKPQYFALDQLDATVPADGPMRAKASGRIDQTLRYQLAFDGGPFAALITDNTDWPFNIKLEFLDSIFTASGKLGDVNSSLRFGFGTPDLAKFGRLLEIDLPDAGAAGIGGLLRVAPGKITLTELSGVLGKTSLTGALAVDMQSERPRLSGALALPMLDLRPFLGQDTEDDEPPTNLRELYLSLARARLDLQQLNHYDMDLSLKVGQWLSLPGELHDAALSLQLADGKLALPLKATISGVPIKGLISADASKLRPSFGVTVSAEKSDIAGLATLLTGAKGIEGRLGRFQLALSSEGNRGQELMQSLAIKLALSDSKLSYGNVAGGKPVDFTLDKLALTLPAHNKLQGMMAGTLLGHPLHATLNGGALADSIEQGSTPLELIARSRGVVARIAGTLNAEQDNRSATDASKESSKPNSSKANLVFSVGADRAGEVASWFGLRPNASVPLALGGSFSNTSNSNWQLSHLVFQLGRSTLYANVGRTGQGSRSHLDARIDIANIDSAELDSLLAPTGNTKKTLKSKAVPTLDIPILPQQIVLSDADVSVRVRKVDGTRLAMRDLSFDARLREGFMQPSAFRAYIADTAFEGALMLDLRAAVPRIQLWLAAADVNAGRILQELKLVDQLDATLARVGLYLDSQSSQLSALIANARLSGQIEGGKLVLKDKNTKSALHVALQQGVLSAAPGERVQLNLTGAMDAVPIAISLRSATAKDLINPALRVPFDLSIEAVQTRLALSGTLDRDIDARDVELAMQISGPHLEYLNPLLRVSLPPWGPWSAAGQFRMSRSGYAVNQLKLQVGSSTLTGRGVLETISGQAKLDIALAAPLIQLDDFKTGSWSATGDGSMPLDAALDQDALRKKATETSDQVQGMLSPAMLKRLNATLAVEVERVMSGGDQLGGGSLRARLENGRADIGPVKLAMPGGAALLSLAYEPGEREVWADLKIDVDRFDYGVLARRIKPESDMDGRFSVHLDVASRAARLSEILRHGSGQLDFAVWPQNLNSGVFDMWAVNVLVALLPTLDPKNESKVNCAIGRFALDNGKLTQKQLVIDTSQMRVAGNAAINFADEKIQMRLQPQAKSAQFLSLATPIEVRGDFKKFSVGPNAGDVMETVIRLATSVVWVPIKKLFADKVPADGSDVCVLAPR